MPATTTTARLAYVRDLIEQHENDWDGSDDAEKIAAARFAVVIERDDDSWVRAAGSVEDVSALALGCYVGTEGYDEWIESVHDLDALAPVAWTQRVAVTVTIGAAAATTTDTPATTEDETREPAVCAGTGDHAGQPVDTCDECAEHGPWEAETGATEDETHA